MRLVGYTYQAETLCPACVRPASARIAEANGINSEFVGVEDLLDRLAPVLGLDRYDETTFDSDDFPKVVWSCQVDSTETCDGCGEEAG